MFIIMSGQLKEVRGRIKSVKSTQQITKAMKLVSAAKLRRAQEAITNLRPYADKLQEMLSNIVASLESNLAMPLAEERDVKRVAVVIMTSDRGLCGGFNSNIIKAAKHEISSLNKIKESDIDVYVVGKKAFDQAKKWENNLITDFQELANKPQFEQASELVNSLSEQFIQGKVDKVICCYAKFKNAAMQEFKAEQFLPIQKPSSDDASNVHYIFEPEKEALIEELTPRILRTTLFKYLLDNQASEHGARMTAMDKATDNASELLKDLNLAYNRARQAAITTELSEIVSGAAALEG